MKTLYVVLAAIIGLMATWAITAVHDLGIAKKVESSLQMPEHALLLPGYDRFYYRTAEEGRDGVGFVFTQVPRTRSVIIPGSCATERIEGLPGVEHSCSARNVALKPRVGVVRFVQEDEAPRMSDGGCEMITGFFDSAAGKVKWIACNGHA